MTEHMFTATLRQRIQADLSTGPAAARLSVTCTSQPRDRQAHSADEALQSIFSNQIQELLPSSSGEGNFFVSLWF